MKRILLIIVALFVFLPLAFANDKQEVLGFFNNYVKEANSYSQNLPKYYSPNAKIIRQVVKPDGTTADAVTNSATYIKQMKISQSIAKLRHYTNNYTNINVVSLGNGAYKVSALRSPMQDNDKLKTYMIVKKIDGKWTIIEEMMQTRQQIFLKYAK